MSNDIYLRYNFCYYLDRVREHSLLCISRNWWFEHVEFNFRPEREIRHFPVVYFYGLKL